jgi:hypothetical protein
MREVCKAWNCQHFFVGKKCNKKMLKCCYTFGYLPRIKWLRKNGYEWIDKYRSCKWSSKYGHLDCLKYAHENGCEFDSDTCLIATRHGYLECLKYAHENGCEWDIWTCAYASYCGQLDCLRYAQENGCS